MCGVDGVGQRLKPNALFSQVRHGGDQVRQRPAEPIQTPNQKGVASVQASERLLKAGSFRAGPGALIGEDILGARSTKRVELQVEVLLSGGDAGISNLHAAILGQIFGTRKSMNSLDSLTCIEKDRLRDGS